MQQDLAPGAHRTVSGLAGAGKGCHLEVFFEEAEAKALAVRPDDLGKCW